MKLTRRALRGALIIFVSAAAIGTVFTSGCNQPAKLKTAEAFNGDVKHDGALLVQRYCAGSCHQLVPVNALTKAVWIIFCRIWPGTSI
jgi:hypothetical protein